jgi:hypothetical protein
LTQSRRAFALAGLLAGCVAAIGGCTQTSSPDPGAASTSAAPAALPLAAYLTQLPTVHYADYVDRSQVRVRDEAAFEDMRQYLIRRYEGASVTSSLVIGGVVFDCLRQEANAAGPPPAAAEPPEVAGAPGPVTSPAGSAPEAPGPAHAASVSAVPCPPGSVPVRRVTLDDLTRFPSLAAFLGKGPGSETPPPTGSNPPAGAKGPGPEGPPPTGSPMS